MTTQNLAALGSWLWTMCHIYSSGPERFKCSVRTRQKIFHGLS